MATVTLLDFIRIYCLHCGRDITDKKSHAKKGEPRKYCNRKCSGLHLRGKPPVYINCVICGKQSKVKPCKEYRKKYCSRHCKWLAEVNVLTKRLKPSIFQKEVFAQIKQIYPNSHMEYQIKGWFVDIFVPDKNLCIECDGAYWHDDKFFPGKKELDRLRQESMEALGYRFVRIPQKQWMKDNNVFRYL